MDEKKRMKVESLDKVAGGEASASEKYYCKVCGYVYDPADHGGVAFAALDELEWKCPLCSQPKYEFEKM